jgi:hypothetical protein
MSSNASNALAFNNVIKDFKKALGDRKTPKNILILNRIMIGILLLTIILTGADYGILLTEVSDIQEASQHNLYSESRSLLEIQLASNVRSFINVANNLEFDNYDGPTLSPIDRYEYLGVLI